LLCTEVRIYTPELYRTLRPSERRRERINLPYTLLYKGLIYDVVLYNNRLSKAIRLTTQHNVH